MEKIDKREEKRTIIKGDEVGRLNATVIKQGLEFVGEFAVLQRKQRLGDFRETLGFLICGNIRFEF